jgi:hypothetical protein
MSQAKISRIETGKVLPTVIDVEQVIKALDIPAGVAADLLELARAANVDYASWRAYARTGLWRKQVEIKALAESAKIVRQFLPAVPTGLLQTEAVARSTLLPTVDNDPTTDLEKAVRARLASREVLGDSSRRFVFLMTEQAVRWRLVDPRAMAEQAEHMAEVSRWDNIEIAIIPCGVKVPEVPLNVFVVYDERLVTAELFSGGVVLRDPRDVAYHLELFEFFLSHALRGEDAVGFLHALSGEFMRELD